MANREAEPEETETVAVEAVLVEEDKMVVVRHKEHSHSADSPEGAAEGIESVRNRRTRSITPTGFHTTAQGCRAAATLGY